MPRLEGHPDWPVAFEIFFKRGRHRENWKEYARHFEADFPPGEPVPKSVRRYFAYVEAAVRYGNLPQPTSDVVFDNRVVNPGKSTKDGPILYIGEISQDLYAEAASALTEWCRSHDGWQMVARELHTDHHELKKLLKDDEEATAVAETPEILTAEIPTAAPHLLPPRTPYFLGRDSGLTEVKQMLLEGQTVVLHGGPGVGKSTLAIHIGHDLASEFPDGVIWISLETATAEDGLNVIAGSYGLPQELDPFSPVDIRANYLRHKLSARRLLLIVDDAVRSDEVEPLLSVIGGRPALVTTRQRDLAALREAAIVTIPPLSLGDGCELFLRASRITELSDPEQRTLRSLVADVEGLPLAIRLLGERAHRGGWGVVQTQARLKELRLAAIRYGQESIKDINLTLSIELSTVELASPLRAILSALAAHNGGDAETAAVAYVADIDTMMAADLLDELHGLGLAFPSVGGRWRLHSLIRLHAEDTLLDLEHVRRASKYYTTLAEDAQPHDDELHDLSTLADAALSRGAAKLGLNMTRMGAWVFDLFWLGRTPHEWNARLRETPELHPIQSIFSQGQTESDPAQSPNDRSYISSVQEMCVAAIFWYRDCGDWYLPLAYLSNVVYVDWMRQDTDVACILATLGWIARDAGSHKAAVEWWQQSLAIWRRREEWLQAAVCLDCISGIERQLGNLEAASRFDNEAERCRQMAKDGSAGDSDT